MLNGGQHSANAAGRRRPIDCKLGRTEPGIGDGTYCHWIVDEYFLEPRPWHEGDETVLPAAVSGDGIGAFPGLGGNGMAYIVKAGAGP